METERNRKCQKDRDMFLKRGGRESDRQRKEMCRERDADRKIDG